MTRHVLIFGVVGGLLVATLHYTEYRFVVIEHFIDSYFAAQIHKVQSSGLDPATTAARVAAIQRSQQAYQNPIVNAAYTFMEPLPVGPLITLLSAAVLRRKAPAAPISAPGVMQT
jgi:Protein of unknown function (DUF4199)